MLSISGGQLRNHWLVWSASKQEDVEEKYVVTVKSLIQDAPNHQI